MLRGEKVTIRAVERDDLRRIWELRNDVQTESLAFGPPIPRSMTDIEAWFDRVSKDPSTEVFVIEAGGAVVGQCNLRDGEDSDRTVVIGISLASTETGKGYGSDAIRVLLDLCLRHRNLHRVWLEALASNERAIRAYHRCGFLEEGRLRQHTWFDGRHEDVVVMGILRDEWLARGDEG